MKGIAVNSELFVNTVVALAGVLTGVASAWFARIAVPAYRLAIGAPVSSRLFQDGSPAVISRMSMMVNGREIASPHISIISIEVTGRSDITREKFDRGLPLPIDIRAEILDVIQTDGRNCIQGNGLTFTTSESTLFVGPDLLKSGQQSFLQVLTEGPPDFSGLEQQIMGRLIDVRPAGRLATRTAFERVANSLKAGSILVVLALCVTGIFAAGWGYARSDWDGAPLITAGFRDKFPISAPPGTQRTPGVRFVGQGFRGNRSLTVNAIAWGDPLSQEMELGQASTSHDGLFTLDAPGNFKSTSYLVTVLDDGKVAAMRLVDIPNE